MNLNNFSITVNRVTHNLFFYFSRVKVTHPELGFEERNASPTSQRDRREAHNRPQPTPQPIPVLEPRTYSSVLG